MQWGGKTYDEKEATLNEVHLPQIYFMILIHLFMHG